MTYRVTKTYGHEIGLSCCFRQWRAKSHCRFLHGYALAVTVEFEAEVLDERNWVVDFGSLKSFKGWLVDMFDHKLLVAEDDPCLYVFKQLESADRDLAEVVVVPATGCEAFAKLIYDYAERWLYEEFLVSNVKVTSVEVREHGANGASYHHA
jgi:6-pyruvoyltetrahydropterin/6-carboxytetrahydropterin synthase